MWRLKAVQFVALARLALRFCFVTFLFLLAAGQAACSSAWVSLAHCHAAVITCDGEEHGMVGELCEAKYGER
jgi:hypothetical protein